MPLLKLLRLLNYPILQQLQLEEALLRADKGNWCLLNQGTPDAVVMGISGKAEELVDLIRLHERQLPLIRRFSGGGTVLVDRNTCFVTLICNESAVPIKPFPEPIMQWNARLYINLLKEANFSKQANDYALGNKKFGGNAQSIVKGRWLHHSSLLWDYCPDKMQVLLQPKKTPEYRADRSHTAFLCTLKEHLPSKEHLNHGILQALQQFFTIEEVKQENVMPILESPHRRATTLLHPN